MQDFSGEVFVGLPALYSTDELSLWMSELLIVELKVTFRSARRCCSSAATVLSE